MFQDDDSEGELETLLFGKPSEKDEINFVIDTGREEEPAKRTSKKRKGTAGVAPQMKTSVILWAAWIDEDDEKLVANIGNNRLLKAKIKKPEEESMKKEKGENKAYAVLFIHLIFLIVRFIAIHFEKGDVLRVRSITNQVWNAEVVEEGRKRIKVSYIPFGGNLEEWINVDSERIERKSVINCHGLWFVKCIL